MRKVLFLLFLFGMMSAANAQNNPLYQTWMVPNGAGPMLGLGAPMLGGAGPMVPNTRGGGVQGAPTVTAVAPNSGSTGGGTPVVLTGTNFTGVTAVKFGLTNASSFTFVNSSTINATSPAGSLGTINVTVTTGQGTSATGAPNQFTYTAGCSNSLDFSQACNSQYVVVIF